MSCLHELRPEFLVIVYLSVEDKDHTPILVVKRLITHRRKIYDAQTSEAQSRILIHIFSFTVRASVYDRIHHIYENLLSVFHFAYKTCESTHIAISPFTIKS